MIIIVVIVFAHGFDITSFFSFFPQSPQSISIVLKILNIYMLFTGWEVRTGKIDRPKR